MKNNTVYVINYDIENTGNDLDFFWSKEARDNKLKEIMEACIENWKNDWDDASDKERQAVLDVEQLISHEKIEEAFYSDAWDRIKGEDDYYYLYESEIPKFITESAELAEEITALLYHKQLIPDSEECQAEVAQHIRDVFANWRPQQHPVIARG